MIKKLILFLFLITFIFTNPVNILAQDMIDAGIPPITEVTEKGTSGMLGGASITMLSSQTRSQIMSFLIKTKDGKVIIIDGGLKEDAKYLTKKIKENGGVVSAWFLTHAHKDHTGALAEILMNDELTISIEHVYYSFPTVDWVHKYEESNIKDLQTINEALGTLLETQRHSGLKKGEQIQIDDITITIMNEFNPKIILDALNNSSIVYRFDINLKKVVFLGDLGNEGGAALLNTYKKEELKCDIVQMSHHGQSDIGQDIYIALKPDICLWPTPRWLWYNIGSSSIHKNSGGYTTLTTRRWMEELGVKKNYVGKDGDQIIY